MIIVVQLSEQSQMAKRLQPETAYRFSARMPPRQADDVVSRVALIADPPADTTVPESLLMGVADSMLAMRCSTPRRPAS